MTWQAASGACCYSRMRKGCIGCAKVQARTLERQQSSGHPHPMVQQLTDIGICPDDRLFCPRTWPGMLKRAATLLGLTHAYPQLDSFGATARHSPDLAGNCSGMAARRLPALAGQGSGTATGAHGDALHSGQGGHDGSPSTSGHEGVAEGGMPQRIRISAKHVDGRTA